MRSARLGRDGRGVTDRRLLLTVETIANSLDETINQWLRGGAADQFDSSKIGLLLSMRGGGSRGLVLGLPLTSCGGFAILATALTIACVFGRPTARWVFGLSVERGLDPRLHRV